MKNLLSSFTLLFFCGLAIQPAVADHVWINEFHYDDVDADENEFIEVAIRTPNGSGLAASDYVVSLYNGSDQQLYSDTGTLGSDIFNVGTDFVASSPFAIANSTDSITLYTLSLPSNGLQNGNDGIALTTTTGTLVQFLSYEGAFTAIGGLADGVTSTDLGLVFETNASPEGTSLGATGVGFGADQFNELSFAIAEGPLGATPGAINTGQTFAAAAIPEPGSFALLGLAGLAAVVRRRRK